MWQVLVVLILDGVAHKQYRTYFPPLLGDRIVLSGGEVIVVERTWKEAFTEQPIMDVVVKKARKK